MERVPEVKRCSLKVQRSTNDCCSEPVTSTEQSRAETRKGRVLPNEAFVDGWCGDNGNPRARKDLLERPRVVVSVTMGDDDGNDRLRAYALPLERGGRVRRRIHHDSSAVDPYHVPARRTILVEPVRVP
jgi:hypothetical protein